MADWQGQEYTFQAEVQDAGKKSGINGGRVSKLTIWRGDRWTNENKIYEYGELDNAPPELLALVLEVCEKFPAHET